MLSPSAGTKFAIVENPPKENSKKSKPLSLIRRSAAVRLVCPPKIPKAKIRSQATKNKLAVAQAGETVE